MQIRQKTDFGPVGAMTSRWTATYLDGEEGGKEMNANESTVYDQRWGGCPVLSVVWWTHDVRDYETLAVPGGEAFAMARGQIRRRPERAAT